MGIVLDDTDKSLQIVLGGAVSTAQVVFSVDYVDTVEADLELEPQQATGASSNTTAVTLAASPSSGEKREVVQVTIWQADDADVTLTLQLLHDSDTRIIWKGTLEPGDKLTLNHQGIQVMDNTGAEKQS